MQTSSFHAQFCCNSFLAAHLYIINSAAQKELRRILRENTRLCYLLVKLFDFLAFCQQSIN
jgi:hypothetical protein